MTTKHKPDLWLEGMSYQEYLIRLDFYRDAHYLLCGTAKDDIGLISNLPAGYSTWELYDCYEDELYDVMLSNHSCQYIDYNPPWCSEELLQYSLYGVSAIKI